MLNTKKTIYQKKNYLEKNPNNINLKDFLFITGGDPAGIGPEIIRKSLIQLGKKYKNLKIIYFFNSNDAERDLLLLELADWEIYFINKWNEKEFKILDNCSNTNRNVLYIYEIGYYSKLGPSVESAKLALNALEVAIKLIKQYDCKGLVTGPVSKEWIGKIYPTFSGHTGYLAKKFHCNVLMIMYSTYFSVLPITEHIPLKKVSIELKRKLKNKHFINLLKDLYQKQIFKKGWAFCGLNPHAGDNGLLGTEEKEYIIPFIKKLKKSHIPIEGPYSADSLFTKEKLEKFDLILACYHDQGLIPFKTIVGKEGINLTYGLPFIRTSPDHGTAFDIVHLNIADSKSMYNAMEFHYKEIWN